MLGDIEVCLTKDFNSQTGTETEKEINSEKNSNSPSCKDKENHGHETNNKTNINIMIGKKTKRQNIKEEEKDDYICSICNKDEGKKDFYKCNQCEKLFHLDCLKPMEKEIKEEIMAQCQLCEILIKNDFEDLDKFCTHKTRKSKFQKKI